MEPILAIIIATFGCSAVMYAAMTGKKNEELKGEIKKLQETQGEEFVRDEGKKQDHINQRIMLLEEQLGINWVKCEEDYHCESGKRRARNGHSRSGRNRLREKK